VSTALTAFPADGFTARWQTWDHHHGETLTLRWENEGWTATGEVGREAVTYVIRLSATWHVRQFLLFRDLDQPDLWLGTDGAGGWGEINGARRPDLEGCTDIELASSPFPHTVPIRRLQLAVGESAEVVAARVDVEALGVTPVRRRYERVGPRRYVLHALGDRPDGGEFDVPTTFDVDAYGLVHDLSDAYRRT
jgi:hypothetical protein